MSAEPKWSFANAKTTSIESASWSAYYCKMGCLWFATENLEVSTSNFLLVVNIIETCILSWLSCSEQKSTKYILLKTPSTWHRYAPSTFEIRLSLNVVHRQNQSNLPSTASTFIECKTQINIKRWDQTQNLRWICRCRWQHVKWREIHEWVGTDAHLWTVAKCFGSSVFHESASCTYRDEWTKGETGGK